MRFDNDIVVFICNSYFPFGRAYSSRVLNFCRLFHSMGITAYVIADFSNENGVEYGEEYSIEGIHYYILGKQNKKNVYFEKYKKGSECLQRIIENNFGKKIHIILSASDTRRYKDIVNICKHNTQIDYIIESCEWYDKSSYTLSILDPRYRLFQHRIKHDYLHGKRIIAISRYLDNYYKRFDNTVIRIPTILDVSNEEYSLRENNKENKIRIMFAGAISGNNKELFAELLFALAEPSIREHFVLDIYGGTIEALTNSLHSDKYIIEQLNGAIRCHGFIPQQEISQQYRNSDFSVIFRPNRRSSNAGFPTKLAESLAAGTPVIANDTGDIGKYIIDSENGFIVDYERVSIKRCLEKIRDMSNDNRVNMRKKARITAEESFDYKKYKAIMSEFLRKDTQ